MDTGGEADDSATHDIGLGDNSNGERQMDIQHVPEDTRPGSEDASSEWEGAVSNTESPMSRSEGAASGSDHTDLGSDNASTEDTDGDEERGNVAASEGKSDIAKAAMDVDQKQGPKGISICPLGLPSVIDDVVLQ